MDTLDKGMIHAMEWEGRDFIMLFRMECNLKPMNCLFLVFSINISRTQWTIGNKPWKWTPWIRRDTLVYICWKLAAVAIKVFLHPNQLPHVHFIPWIWVLAFRKFLLPRTWWRTCLTSGFKKGLFIWSIYLVWTKSVDEVQVARGGVCFSLWLLRMHCHTQSSWQWGMERHMD